MKAKIINVIIIYSLLIISCKKDENNSCPYYSTGRGRIVYAPDSGHVNAPITITLVWENNIPCQKSMGFNDSINGNSRQIVLTTKVDSCNCDNSDGGITYRDYIFTVNHPGIQIVHTQTKPNTFKTDTIFVY